jgi:hypothetical protein
MSGVCNAGDALTSEFVAGKSATLRAAAAIASGWISQKDRSSLPEDRQYPIQ